MKIIELGSHAWITSGIGKVMIKLNEEFLKMGHDSTIFSLAPSKYAYMSGFSKSQYLLRVVPIIRRLRPDVIHVHSSFPFGAATAPSGNVVFTVWDPPPPPARLPHWTVYKLALLRAKRVVLVSGYLRRFIGNEVVIPPGVDEVYRPDGRRNNWGLSIFSVGTWEKRADLLVMAFNILKTQLPQLKLIFVRKHPPNQGYESYLLSLCRPEFRKSITFLGPGLIDEEMAECYRSCTVYASASQYEGFGIPFLEANACGKAVVAFRKAAIPYTVHHNVTGLLADDFEQFVNYLKLLLTDEKLRRKLETNAARRAETFSWSNIAKQYLSLFESF